MIEASWRSSRALDRSVRSKSRWRRSFRTAFEWLDEVGGGGRDVLVLEDDAEIVGVVMHEDDDDHRFINALAIRSDRQAQGLGGRVLDAALADLAVHHAGRVVTWLVAPANFASHALSESVGAVASYPPETKPYALYAIEL